MVKKFEHKLELPSKNADKFSISLQRDMITSLSGLDIAIYSILYKDTVLSTETIHTKSATEIGYRLWGEKKVSSHKKREVMDSVRRLAKENYINIEEIEPYIFLVEKIDIPESKYIKVRYRDIEYIMRNSNPSTLLHYLQVIIGRDYGVLSGKQGHHTIEYFEKKESCSKQQIINMNNFLEKNEIIYITHAKYNSNKSNVYCLYEDKDEVLKWLSERDESKSYSKGTGNYSRSMLQKYRWMVTGNKEYSRDEKMEMNRFIISYNNRCEEGKKKELIEI